MAQNSSRLVGLFTLLRPGRPRARRSCQRSKAATLGRHRSGAPFAFLLLSLALSPAQTLQLPPRASRAPSGSAFIQSIAGLPLPGREARIETEILLGNVPDFLRRLRPVTIGGAVGTTNIGTFFVTPDYLAVGSDEDYFLTPMTPQTAQRIADATGCLLPTRKMVDAIHSAAEVKLAPAPIPPSAAMTSVEVFARHNAMVRTQRLAQIASHPPGSLVAGHKKDVVLSNRLTNAPGKVAIYGWHKADGKPIQPLYTGHAETWVDYSQCVRLVHPILQLNSEPRSVAEVLTDEKLATLLSDEGALASVRYSTHQAADKSPAAPRSPEIPALVQWSTNAQFGERTATFQLLPDVRVQINEPLGTAAAPAGSTIALVLYTLPNGNTIEQTAGRMLKPGDDSHFDIQHIAAQTRFVRTADPNRVWVVAYLEAAQKSWPAWRKAHASEPGRIPALVESLARRYASQSLRMVLSGHSGGGSFIFGYFNAVEEIPDRLERIAFLDATYAYDPAQRHPEKLARWLKASDRHYLSVLAYEDAAALLDGKPFVSATGGTWYRSHLMKTNLATHFEFTSRTGRELEWCAALSNRVQLLLKDNPTREIWHTVQVERNGFIQAMLSGTPFEGRGYEYFGPRAYEKWIQSE